MILPIQNQNWYSNNLIKKHAKYIYPVFFAICQLDVIVLIINTGNKIMTYFSGYGFKNNSEYKKSI